MNIIKTIKARLIESRGTNKAFPCKTYASEASAESYTSVAAIEYAHALIHGRMEEIESARYVVFYIAEWDRWVGAIDATEVLARKGAGGYVGACQGFYKF